MSKKNPYVLKLTHAEVEQVMKLYSRAEWALLIFEARMYGAQGTINYHFTAAQAAAVVDSFWNWSKRGSSISRALHDKLWFLGAVVECDGDVRQARRALEF